MKAYRIKEISRLVSETGQVASMPYKLMLKTLDHIKIEPDGAVEVIFLTGTKIMINIL